MMADIAILEKTMCKNSSKKHPRSFQISPQILSSSMALLGNSKSLFHLFLGYRSSSASSSRAAVEFFIDSRSMREVMVLPAVELHQTRPPS
jgi:hypothetical protein